MSDNHPNRHDFHASDSAMVAKEASYPDGSSTGWHTHVRGQLLYAIEGVMVVRCSIGSWVVPPNRALWITAGLAHEVKMFGAVQMHTLYINTDEIKTLPEKTCVIRISSLLRELIVAAMKVPRDYAPDTRDAALMTLLVHELNASDELPLHLPIPEDERIKKICEVLSNHPDDMSTVEQWAERLGVAAKTVHRLFSKETGMTFAQWREQARLMHSLQRIARGDKIIDVALECGYGSPSAFAAMFKRHFGTTPTNYYQDVVAQEA